MRGAAPSSPFACDLPWLRDACWQWASSDSFVSMLGCVTPALIALLAAIGISGSIGWLDYVLLPAMVIFAAAIAGAITSAFKAARISD